MKVTQRLLILVALILLAPFVTMAGGVEEKGGAETAVAIKGPVPYPEGKPMKGSIEKKFNLDEIFKYKALRSYSQAPSLDKFVADGTLPPVEERLPKNPQVLKTGFMSTGIGDYGGVWRDVSGNVLQSWNIYVNHTQGYFGINNIYQESLVKSGPIYLRKDKAEPMPNLATSWEWKSGGKTMIMHLIEGARWSDGDPFDAEDVMFTWEDIIMDPNVNSPTKPSSWMIGGEPVTLEKVDDYTVKWTFPTPYPVSLLFQMDYTQFSVAPAHFLKPFHPKYNPSSDYEGLENSMPPHGIPVPSLGPWVAVFYKTDSLLVHRRNPYYWKVDEQGRQLPYLEEVVFEYAPTGATRTINTLAGSADHANVENPSTMVEVTKRAAEPDAHFTIKWGPEMLWYDVQFNLSTSLGVKTDRDRELRKLFRDVRFRRAVSHALDRDGIAQAIIRGPFLRAFPGGIVPGSLYFDIDSVVYYDYNVASSKALLAELGLEDTDGDGIVNWTEGPMAGKNLVIQVINGAGQKASTQIGEILVSALGQVGIKINPRPLKGAVMSDRGDSGQWELRITRPGQQYAVPFTRWRDLGATSTVTPGWHHGTGDTPRELMPFEDEIADILNQFGLESDFEKRKALMSRYNKLYTENLYTVGVVVGRYGLAMAKRFENIPYGCPAFFYDWTWENIIPEQMWVKPESRIDETMPGVIPIYK